LKTINELNINITNLNVTIVKLKEEKKAEHHRVEEYEEYVEKDRIHDKDIKAQLDYQIKLVMEFTMKYEKEKA